MNRHPLKVGIAGYGVVGQRRRKVIDQHPHLKTVAVSDVKLDRGETPDGVQTYSQYLDLLSENLDLLFVSLPNYIAPEMTIAGLRKGLHVFCEKPPGRDIDDIVQVIRTERQCPGLKLKYGFNHRYHDSVQDALEIITSGSFGRVINLRGVYGKSKIINFKTDWRTERDKSGGGILLDQGIHMLDMMRLFAGEFTDIKSFVSNDYWGHDVEDNAYALMRSADNIVASIHSSATQWRHQFRLEIAMDRGLIILSGILSGSKSYGSETISIIRRNDDGEDIPEETRQYLEDHSWRDEIDEFVSAILEDKPILHGDSSDALKTMELVYRIYCADQVWKDQHNLDCTVPPDIC